MARRTVWLVTGVVAGAASSLYAERKLRRTLEAAQARMQPDALVVEVGRIGPPGRARPPAAGCATRWPPARVEKRRREDELWAELRHARPDDADADAGAGPGTPGRRRVSTPARRGPSTTTDPTAPARAARRSPSHLGN